ncbi:MAG: transporter [Acidobacteriota bacterium]
MEYTWSKTARTLTTLVFVVAPAFAQSPAESPAGALGELITDRPDFTESSEVVGSGVFQFEYGMTLDHESRAVHFSGPELLVRTGIGKRFELRFSGDGLVVERALRNSRARGFFDVDFGAKISVRGESRFLPSFSLIPALSLPTGSRNFSSLGYDPSIKVAYSKGLPAGFSIAGNVNAASLSTPGGRLVQESYSWSVAHSLPAGFGGYWEVFGFTPWDEEGSQAWIANSGVTHGLGANAQVDVRAGRRLTASGPDWFFGFGLAIRQPSHLFGR